MHPHKGSHSNQARVTVYHRHRCLKSPIIMYEKQLLSSAEFGDLIMTGELVIEAEFLIKKYEIMTFIG